MSLFAKAVGGTIVVDSRTFILSLTPAAPGAVGSLVDDTDRIAALEAELLSVGDQDQRSVLARPEMLDLEAASSLSGIPVRTLTHMRRTNRILALARAGKEGIPLPLHSSSNRPSSPRCPACWPRSVRPAPGRLSIF